AVLRPGSEPARLTGFASRASLLRAAGADEVRRLVPDADLLRLDARAFLGHVARDFSPAVLVEGDDFRFGRARGGTVESLRDIGSDLGFRVEVVDEVEVELADQSRVRASSSLVRWLLASGRVEDAASVLGRPYAVSGVVRMGDRRGRTIGFPTANIDFETEPPADGVYACLATLPGGGGVRGGAVLPAAVNVGSRPTVDGVARRVEAHVLGWDGAIGAYDWPLAVHFIRWVRDQVRFGGLDELTTQLALDCERVRRISAAALEEDASGAIVLSGAMRADAGAFGYFSDDRGD
ncbi:MAG: riboflavin kinase, partial [Planctomycetota bacterium]